MAATLDQLETLTACPLCNSAAVAKAPDQPQPPFGLMHCQDCSGIFLSPRPRIEDMHQYYDDFYKGDRKKSSRQELRAKKHFRRLARSMPTPGDILEVGAGDGYFLNAAKEAGWRVQGLELSQPRIEQAKQWFGIDLQPHDLLKADLKAESFDAIAMFQLIEHVHDPRAILKRVHQLLRPGGVLMLSTPNVLAYGRKKRDVDHWLIPRHLFFFTPGSLVTNAESLGFQVVRRSLKLQARLEMKFGWRPWTSSRTLSGAIRNLCTPFALRLVARKR
jgi:2-polyprenyl-3-methyl-5-hydroxy-6-metoxy-1,4-benzoquinol methylase